MYRIDSIEIVGFWGHRSVRAEFPNDVNIIIGRNGTGKTTLMNIIHSVLAVDIYGLADSEFDEVIIKLSDQGRRRTIKAVKVVGDKDPFPVVNYFISNKKYSVRLIHDARFPPALRRRHMETAEHVRDQIAGLIKLASLSVHRISEEIEGDLKERYRPGQKLWSPVDVLVDELIRQLTQYQLELSADAGEIASALQKDVLLSLLYDPDNSESDRTSPKFNMDSEREDLNRAYSQLGVEDRSLKRRIDKHLKAVEDALSSLSKFGEAQIQEDMDVDFSAIDAWTRTAAIVNKSLKAAELRDKVFSQADLFIKTISSFVTDKKFEFVNGKLVITKNGNVPIQRLSSGEKQLLILLIQPLLQRQSAHVFLTDEPELSLHIDWQRLVIPAVSKLNRNAQIIVATHSPEVAGKYKSSILDMEDIIHE